MKAQTQTQKQMQRSADQRILDRCKAFNEIQSGPNPMSLEECRALARDYPDRYGWLERCWRDS